MRKYEQFLQRESLGEDVFTIKLAAKCVGLQKVTEVEAGDINLNLEKKVWVLNQELHVAEDGRLIDAAQSPFIWLGSLRETKGGSDNIASHKFASLACTTQDDSNGATLGRVVDAVKNGYLNNFPSAILALGCQVLNLHYENVLEFAGGVPIALLYGDVQCGKSKIMETALALVGTSTSHLLKSCTDLQLIRACCQSTLGLVLDDITDYTKLLEKIMLLFDGKPIAYKGGTIQPRTSFMAAVNQEAFSGLAKHPR